VKNLEKNRWKCKVCGYSYESDGPPEFCVICESKKFERIKNKNFNLENLEPTEKKKKYRRIFKKGFSRKYKKFK
jgi:Zn finger protein HypA/HybF involved in hydrogenase expression